jgi:hypothetical protein
LRLRQRLVGANLQRPDSPRATAPAARRQPRRRPDGEPVAPSRCGLLVFAEGAGKNIPLSHLVSAGVTAAPGGNDHAVFTLFSLHHQPPNFALQPTVARHSKHRCAVQYAGGQRRLNAGPLGGFYWSVNR